jgi:hypothetical protein
MNGPNVEFYDLDEFRNTRLGTFGTGPAAMVIIEDRVEIKSTLHHVHQLGFRQVFVVAPIEIYIPPPPASSNAPQYIIRAVTHRPNMFRDAVNILISKLPGEWIHYCFNAEYLFYPFCETRKISDLTTFLDSERRQSALTYVVDLYTQDSCAPPNALSLDTAMLDSIGYYAENRIDNTGKTRERQLNFYGGLHWRFQDHLHPEDRRIDRVGLFKSTGDLWMRNSHKLSQEEMNTYQTCGHHSPTGAICSFRMAKMLIQKEKSNHGMGRFHWTKSSPFEWSSTQLMDLGLMEPGQWF